ncbi:Ig-like domain-containing protein [Brucepastera parasyntrophica]|uniref:Ig-like domain-containing protein n=1 Tax=Brucepastera parasyntrophica TaxID=2880008 RepID=UPI00210B6BDF|nr:Ig-like domain-containing protein [Brucepastera parasyntrophica]ULQ58819.1 Ig-like domain-containing protein [Brucepastera parasyntrophica]
MKKYLFICIFSLLSVMMLFSSGKKDTTEVPVKKLDSWHETLDISQKKPGKYNILITATDLAGNQAFEGPYNIFIDPESDLPVVRITNPLEDMRVPGNLNIVGTCIDDDAVAYVELYFDGDEENPVRAEGTEFWSYYLDTNNLSEGKHTITVSGTDIYGVKGRPYSVSWNLDRERPNTEILTPGMGVLVSSKFSISGTVYDGNGIKELSYSLDRGRTFTPVPIKYDKKNDTWTFDVTIITKNMPDGPAVCWFRAVDGQGSSGITTFLYFVDNTKPEVGFISPEDNEAVNGIFSVAGYATDTIGIRSLSWRIGKETGEFEIVKGNPYWVKEIDVRDQKIRNLTVDIIATDEAGNVTTASKKY